MVTKNRLPRFAPEARREHIVKVAKDTFMHEGYAGTSMAAIAAHLGGSKATLYKYFPSKEKLFEAVMQDSCKVVVEKIASDCFTHDTVFEFLVNVGTQSLTAMLAPDALLVSRLVHSEGARHPEITRIFFSNGVEVVNTALAERLAHFHSTGKIYCCEPLLTARQFLGMVRSDLLMQAISGIELSLDNDQIRRHVIHASTLVLEGMAPLPTGTHQAIVPVSLQRKGVCDE